MRGVSPEDEAFTRAWLKVEDRLSDSKKHTRSSITWRPWAHPGGWILLAACLCVTLTGVHYQQSQADNRDLASYLETISKPVVDSAHDDDVVNVTLLLTGPSAEITDNTSSDEDQVNVLQGDEILL